MDPKEIVRRGYDRISYAYRDDEGGGMVSDYELWLSELIPLLAADSPVLELGCGCGLPVARSLARRFDYTGIDFSEVQISRARRLVPRGRFICADMTEVSFPDGFFAAVVSFYAIVHLPLEGQPALFDKIARWLRPGGLFMATVGHTAWTGTESDWLGATMYWSHTDEATYMEWLTKRNFEILGSRFVPEGNGGHTLLMARKRPE